MKKFLVIFFTMAIILSCLTGCGVDKAALDEVTVKLTELETKVNSMFGKVEDMHSTGKMDEDLYMEFMDFSQDLDDAINEAEGNTPDVDNLKETAVELEERIDSFISTIDQMTEANKETLDRELIELSMACSELEDLMENALANGKITQARMDEFYVQEQNIENMMLTSDLEYSDNVRDSIKNIRSSLTAMASEVNADNNLIDRLIDETKYTYSGATEGMSDVIEEQESETVKQPLSENVQSLITNYLDFQTYAVDSNSNGSIDDDTITKILECGVKLTYLKESVEQDGTTENNTIRANSIKSDIYELAQQVGYEKADLFK